jgi:hypothetical protein
MVRGITIQHVTPNLTIVHLMKGAPATMKIHQ